MAGGGGGELTQFMNEKILIRDHINHNFIFPEL